MTYTKTLLVENKVDLPEAHDRHLFFQEVFREHPLGFDVPSVSVSASSGENLSLLGKMMFEALDMVRIYTRNPRTKQTDYEKPYTVPRGTQLIEVARLIHQDLANQFKSARVWGTQVHDGVSVTSEYRVSDKDIVEIQTK